MSAAGYQFVDYRAWTLGTSLCTLLARKIICSAGLQPAGELSISS